MKYCMTGSGVAYRTYNLYKWFDEKGGGYRVWVAHQAFWHVTGYKTYAELEQFLDIMWKGDKMDEMLEAFRQEVPGAEQVYQALLETI